MNEELDYFHVTRKRGRHTELDEARPKYDATVHAELAISSPMIDAVIVERCTELDDGECHLCAICRAESSLGSRARRRVAEDRHRRQRREVPR